MNNTPAQFEETIEIFTQFAVLLPLGGLVIALLGVVTIGVFTIKVAKAFVR